MKNNTRPGYNATTTGNKAIIKKVRSKTNSDIYYTYSNWSTNEIDGITFIPVVKDIPDPKKNQVVHYMRKDNMEFIK
jgi:hypothetical protein